MRFLKLSPLLLLLIFASNNAYAQDEQDVVVEATTAWLALVDDAAYDESWEAGGRLMREAVPMEEWRQALENVNAQLYVLAGDAVDLTQRELVEVADVGDQPGLPEGEYRSVRYRTEQGDMVFAEVVTMQLEDDEWKVVGYFVAPENQ